MASELHTREESFSFTYGHMNMNNVECMVDFHWHTYQWEDCLIDKYPMVLLKSTCEYHVCLHMSHQIERQNIPPHYKIASATWSIVTDLEGFRSDMINLLSVLRFVKTMCCTYCSFRESGLAKNSCDGHESQSPISRSPFLDTRTSNLMGTEVVWCGCDSSGAGGEEVTGDSDRYVRYHF